MEASLRYGGDSNALRITTNNNPPTVKYAGDVSALKVHAKQKLRLDSNTLLQLNGELDTGSGAPTFLCALVRHYYPDACYLFHNYVLMLSATIGAGLHYDRKDKLHCTLRGKKAYPVASNRFVNFVLKGRCDIDKELSQPTPHGALELVWNILDFQRDRDVRLKVGYEIIDKIGTFHHIYQFLGEPCKTQITNFNPPLRGEDSSIKRVKEQEVESNATGEQQ